MALAGAARLIARLNLRRQNNINPRLFFSSSSAAIDDPDERSPVPELSPEETLLVEKFYSVIKDHHRNNPDLLVNPKAPLSPDVAFPSLSLEFSKVSTVDSPPSTDVIRRVVEKCAALRNGIPFPQTLALFNWAKSFLDSSQCEELFNEIIDVCGKVRQFHVAWHIIDSMKAENISIPLETFSNLIRRYIRADMSAEAVHTFNRMQEYGCEPDKKAFSVVIARLAKKRLAFEAQSFFDSLKEKFELDVVVYTSLIFGWCRAGNITEAERVFREMKMAGIQPTAYTYTTVLDALCRCGQITRSHDVFAEMLDAGIEPNAATFNSLMRVHVKAGRTEKVLQVYNQMKRLSCPPDVITYNFLIETHCKEGNRDEAMKILNLMEKNGCKANAWSFNPIFRCIHRDRDVNAAHRLFIRMKEQVRCEPNTVTYNILMQMFAESKSTDMVIKLWKEIETNGVEEPNANTFKIIISMYCGMGHWNNAYKLFKQMIEEKCLKPAPIVYEMVMHQLRKAGELKKHEELMDKMVERGYVSSPFDEENRRQSGHRSGVSVVVG